MTGQVQMVRLDGLQLVCETASQVTRQRGSLGAGRIGFAMCLSPAGTGRFHGQRVDGSSIMIGRGDELDLTLSADAGLVAILVDADELSTLWNQLYGKPWSGWLDSKVVVGCRPGSGELVRQTHLRALAAAKADPGALAWPGAAAQLKDAVLIEWLEAIPAVVDVSELASVRGRERLVQQACQLVLTQPDRPVSMLAICASVGTSRRRLEMCFEDVLGVSPQKYFRAARLGGVRRELKAAAGPDCSVSAVAARWGFWHLSAFAADYRRQFGESPSTTLKRSRA
jgi:AraC family ethanolamine operon transcriptional activator